MPEKADTEHRWMLSDEDLTSMKTADGEPIIEPISQKPEPGKNNPNSGTYLLRVGRIFLGRAELKGQDIDEESSSEGLTKHWLDSGDMAIVETLETVRLPNDCVGIVFGTNTLTSKGLLIFNPGIITAGHKSTIRFFVVNYGHGPCKLPQGDKIARLLVFRYPAHNHPGDFLPDYKAGHDKAQEKLYRTMTRLLGERIANDALDKLEDRLTHFETNLENRHNQLHQDYINYTSVVDTRIDTRIDRRITLIATLVGIILATIFSIASGIFGR